MYNLISLAATFCALRSASTLFKTASISVCSSLYWINVSVLASFLATAFLAVVLTAVFFAATFFVVVLAASLTVSLASSTLTAAVSTAFLVVSVLASAGFTSAVFTAPPNTLPSFFSLFAMFPSSLIKILLSNKKLLDCFYSFICIIAFC